MQRKDGSSLPMLLSKQFHKRRKELFSFCGETLHSRNPGRVILYSEFCKLPRKTYQGLISTGSTNGILPKLPTDLNTP